MWQRKQYEDAAADIGKNYAEGNNEKSINDLAVKVARDNNLNPEGIRTLVRLSNVSAFQELFTKSAGDDRMIEYQVGDPELVITQLYTETKTAAVQSQATPTDYSRSNDYYGAFSITDKVAEDTSKKEIADAALDSETTPDAPVVDKQQVKMLFTQAKDKIESDIKEAEYGWYSCIEKAAQTLRCSTGSDFKFDKVAFDADMLAAGGDEIIPDLRALSQFTGAPAPQVCEREKVAAIMEFHVPKLSEHSTSILGFLKEAATFRAHRTRCRAGLDMLTKKIESV